MAEVDEKNAITQHGLSLNETENFSASSLASEAPSEQEARRVNVSASVTAPQPTAQKERRSEPELPPTHTLSDTIILRYEGSRHGKLFHGEGVAYFRAGHVYKGSFVDGFMQGRGEYTWADGLKYEGDFASNVPNGHGTYTWLDCSTYEGDVCNGIRHGTGTYKSAKVCTVYMGQWHKGQRHGKGIMYYNVEKTSWYKGDWEYNQKAGWGVRCYPSGDIYEGQWKNSVRHGEGTMKWIELGQQYTGQWLNGIQHGHGIHTWFVQRGFDSQYPLRNEYKGEFAQGLRHGQGTFVYASGAVYSGCFKNNKKHGQGKYIFKNGHVYEGEFIDDHPAGGLPSRAEMSGSSASILGTDISLNIETLLKHIPEARRMQEHKQVEFAVLRHIALLRSIYSVYSSLGHEKSPDNTFLLIHLQFWRFLKDCNVHQHGLTLAQLDHLINEDVSPGEVLSPFSTMLLRKWISCIVIAAYHVYHRDFASSSYALAEYFSKLMTQNIIPNAKNVKGPLYCHPIHAVISNNYTDKCWEIYQTVPKITSAAISNIIMTPRHFIWMFKVLGLFDRTLTTRRLLEILSLENPAIYSSTVSNLDMEINFLEFFEALLNCAEVKDTHGVGTVQHRQCDLGYTDDSSSRDQMKNSPILSQLTSQQCESTVLSSSTIISSAPSIKPLEEFQSKATLQSSLNEEMQIKGVAEECRAEEELENWISRIHQFFTHTFFPSYEHYLVCEKEMQEERQRQITENTIALEEAKSIAKLREQQRAEERAKEIEQRSKEKTEKDALDDLNNSSANLTTSETSSTVDLKQSANKKRKKKK